MSQTQHYFLRIWESLWSSKSKVLVPYPGLTVFVINLFSIGIYTSTNTVTKKLLLQNFFLKMLQLQTCTD